MKSDTVLATTQGFRHEAIFYSGEADFVARTGSFIEAGVHANEVVLVVVSAEKIELLKGSLGAEAAQVVFADMSEVGQNPARIIPAWREFVSDHVAQGRTARGVGEPIWAARSQDELVECERHEALLNLAFDGPSPSWWLACPYDVSDLAPAVIEVARRNHPFLTQGTRSAKNASFPGAVAAVEASGTQLPAPEHVLHTTRFEQDDLADVRALVTRAAASFGLTPARQRDLVVAVSEVATNSIRHAGGDGTLLIWERGDSLICDVRDRGAPLDPLIGRARPDKDQTSGYGMWLVNQLCDVVQIRTLDGISVVRLHMAR